MGDHHLTWLFTAGSIFWVLLFLWRLRWALFPNIPSWAGFPIAFGVALATPFPWLVSRPEVYEAAIAGGQFFFLAGLYALLMAHLRAGRRWLRIAFAGACWSLAVGARITLAPVVVVLSLIYAVVRIREFARTGTWREGVRSIGPFLLVLALGALILAWYNQDRFGSIWELGHRYQLGRGDKDTRHKNVISPSNIPFNLYNYLLNPVKRIGVFPFVKPEWGRHAISFLRLDAPGVYHTEQVVGLLLSTPLVLYAALPAACWLWRAWQDWGSPEGKAAPLTALFRDRFLAHTCTFLGAAVLLESGPLLIFIASTERHLMDAVPTLMLLSGIGYWHGLQVWGGSPTRRLLVGLTGWVLSICTAVMGILLAVTGYQARFEVSNPELFERIMRFFAW